jgi:hypothetical protein
MRAQTPMRGEAPMKGDSVAAPLAGRITCMETGGHGGETVAETSVAQ